MRGQVGGKELPPVVTMQTTRTCQRSITWTYGEAVKNTNVIEDCLISGIRPLLGGGGGGQDGYLVRSLVDGTGSYSVAHRPGLLPTELTGMWGWILLRSLTRARGHPQPPPPLSKGLCRTLLHMHTPPPLVIATPLSKLQQA